MKNFHVIEVKYLGPTNTRGSRVKLTSTRFNDSITLSTDYAHNTTVSQAIEWLEKHGQKVAGTAELSNNTDAILLEAIDGRFYSINDLKQCKHGVSNAVLCAHCIKLSENKK